MASWLLSTDGVQSCNVDKTTPIQLNIISEVRVCISPQSSNAKFQIEFINRFLPIHNNHKSKVEKSRRQVVGVSMLLLLLLRGGSSSVHSVDRVGGTERTCATDTCNW